MNDGDNLRKTYRQPINYENGVILPLIRDTCISRRTDPKMYQIDIQTLSIVLPKDLRKTALKFFKNDTMREDLTIKGKETFDNYLIFLLELLEDNNICFPKLSYTVGHD